MLSRYTVMMVLFMILLVAPIGSLLAGEEKPSKIVFLDVGVGDSTFIQVGSQSVFIDAGPIDNVIFHLRSDIFEGIEQIDLLLITHMHSDHYEGAFELVRRYDIQEIWLPDICNKILYDKLIGEFQGRIKYISEKETFRFIDKSVLIEGLVVDESDGNCIISKSGDDLNNASIITKISSANQRVLLMGDVYSEKEKVLISQDRVFVKDISVLKAAHHCSKTSNSEFFLATVNPNLIICSTGEGNRHNHPSIEVLERFEKLNMHHLTTWREGNIVVDL